MLQVTQIFLDQILPQTQTVKENKKTKHSGNSKSEISTTGAPRFNCFSKGQDTIDLKLAHNW